MFADITLRRGEHVPQGFALSDGFLYVSQANTTTGDAWVTRYTHLYNEWWRWESEMFIRDSHGWPLFANTDNGGQIGLILTTGTDAFYWKTWQPDGTMSYTNSIKTTKIPIADGQAGGWARTNGNGTDKFYKDGVWKFSRPSPGWVQGEISIDDVLYTLRGSPSYYNNPYPDGVIPAITYTSEAGQVTGTDTLPECIGRDETGQIIGGRKEHEGLAMDGGKLLIGTAVCFKPAYRYQITELEL